MTSGTTRAPARRRTDRRLRRTERRLRRTVERFGGCLSLLTRRQRRVLVLRAGIGSARPTSRSRVAARLDLSIRQVRRAERRGLRTLRRAGAGGCATTGERLQHPTAYSVLPPDAGRRSPAAHAPGARPGGQSTSDGASAGQGGVKGATATRPAPAIRSAPAILPELPGAGSSDGLVLLALLGMTVGLAVLVTRRRSGAR